MTMPKVSLVMSVYNGQRYLRLAVKSILAQTWGDFEFIIINDGSTDDSGALLRTYAAQDARVRLIDNARNLGLTRSLNLGLERARGEYFGRQDADDISAPERLARQVAFMDAHPEIGVAGTLSEVIDGDGRPLVGASYHSALTTNADLQERLLRNNPICHGSVLMRRNLAVAAGGYDESVGPTEDYDLWLRLAEVTQLANVEPVLYYYRVHPESIGRTRYAEQVFDGARVLERALRRRGEPVPVERLAVVAEHDLASAQAAYAAGDFALAARALSSALRLSPTLFGVDSLRGALEAVYTPNQPLAAGQQFTRQVFAALPRVPTLTRLEARLLARLYMREVFEGHGQADHARVRRNWWTGLRHDPRWLLHRGVLTIGLRAFLRPRT
jgi:glycosyltransferase involved in cell wall biosynthesis